MHGLLIGAIFGIGVLACASGTRSLRARNALSPEARASRAVLAVSAALQYTLGAACIVLGVWLLITSAPV